MSGVLWEIGTSGPRLEGPDALFLTAIGLLVADLAVSPSKLTTGGFLGE